MSSFLFFFLCELAVAGAEGPRGSYRPAAGTKQASSSPADRRPAGGQHSIFCMAVCFKLPKAACPAGGHLGRLITRPGPPAGIIVVGARLEVDAAFELLLCWLFGRSSSSSS